MTTKICTKCGEEKKLSEFNKDNRFKSNCRPECKECRSIIRKKRYKNNKENINKQNNGWYENNKKRRLETSKEWIKNNPERHLEIHRKAGAKRKRNFGYIPLNKKFPGSVGHHISMDLVVYIPEELHKSIPHRYDDPISMGEINILALEYLPEGGLNV